jgi:hypothetical protein
MIGFLATTISPYLLFWHRMHRVEDMREEDAGALEPITDSGPSEIATNNSPISARERRPAAMK